MPMLPFISDEDFYEHVANTINEYVSSLEPYDLKKFNSNRIDPIKLLFDKSILQFEWEDIVKTEVYRQRDKANNNSIGYFHQKIFKYIDKCEVPEAGWDVIFRDFNGINVAPGITVKSVYAEMKNKHNTMNSASKDNTYKKMQQQVLADDDSACMLVEVIAKHSQNIVWTTTVDKEKRSNKYIRRVSIDQFYELVTGIPDAFHQVCMALPGAIEHVLETQPTINSVEDSVYSELSTIAKGKGGSMPLALYILGFEEYKGF